MKKKYGKVFMHQKKFINQLMTRYPTIPQMKTSTPTLVGAPITRRLDHEEELENVIAYPSLVGSLMFLASRTRPDITHAVVSLSQYNGSPGLRHWKMLARVLQYVGDTIHWQLNLSGIGRCTLRGFSDSNWASDMDDRKSMSGYIIMIDKVPISWASRKQKSVSLSTMKAEYVAMSETAKEMVEAYPSGMREIGNRGS